MDDTYQVFGGASLTVDVAEGLLGNDLDADGDALTATLVDPPSHGSLVLAPDGSFDYVPEIGFTGTDTFTYQAEDVQDDSNKATVTITVEHFFPGLLGGTVFEDANRNRIHDPGEPGMAGWTVQLMPSNSGSLPLQAIANPTSTSTEYFGYALAATDSRLLVGANRADGDDPDVGAAYLFDVTSGELLLTFANPTPAAGDLFGWSVALLGNGGMGGDLLVGAYRDDSQADNAGAVYLFSGETGALIRTFHSPTATAGAHFGYTVGVSGGDVLVGAPGTGSGAGSVYRFDAASGVLLQTFANPTPKANDQFGSSLAAVGNLVVVGSPLDDTGADNAGAAYVFDAANGDLVHTLANPHPDADDRFGSAVAATAGSVLVGTPFDDENGTVDAGAVYLFQTATGELSATLHNPTPTGGDRFGASLAASNDRILVGARLDDTAGVNSGAVYRFDGTGNELLQTLLPPDATGGEQFGTAMAVVGNGAAVGAYLADLQATNDGAVYLLKDMPEAVLAVTDDSGYYEFTNLMPSGYRTQPVVPEGFFQTQPGGNTPYQRTIAADQQFRDLDFGVFQNDLPIAVDDEYRTNEDEAISVSLSGLLANDVDLDPLTVLLVAAPQHGQLTLHLDGSFDYLPDADFHGIDQFSYQAVDGLIASNAATVQITVDPINDPPTADEEQFLVDKGRALDVSSPGVLANDFDIEGDALSIILEEDVAHGELILQGDGSFSYTPDEDFSGTDQFRYRVSDSSGQSSVATATIIVRPWMQEVFAADPGAVARDQFGWSVAIDGDQAIIAGREQRIGCVYLFHRQADGSWAQVAKHTDVGQDGRSLFGQEVAISGNYAAVAGRSPDGAGVVYVLHWANNDWNLVDALRPSDPHDFDHFGNSLAMSGGTVFVGAGYDDVHDGAFGAVYVFQKNGEDWQEVGQLAHSNSVSGDSFGQALDITGDTLVATAFWRDHPGYDEVAYVFQRQGATWQETSVLSVPNSDYSDFLDTSIAIVGDDILIGMPWDDTLREDAGAVHAFHAIDGIWSKSQTLLAPAGSNDIRFGHELALHNGYALIGVSGDSAYLFERQPDGRWLVGDSVKPPLHQSDRDFGASMALGDKNQALVGGPGAYQPQVGNVGASYFFTIAENHAPSAWPDQYQAYANHPLTVAVDESVLQNDADRDLDPLSAVLVTAPAHGDLLLVADGSFTYTPESGFVGEDTFTYLADDGSATSEAATVTLTVVPDSLSGTVFDDLDGNGIRDEGEPGLPGWTVDAFRYDGVAELLRTIASPLSDQSGGFGRSMAVEGNRLLIGAPDGNDGAGLAYLIDATTGELLHTLSKPSAAAGDHFGMAVAFVGGRLAVAAPEDDIAGTDAGAVYLFDAADGQLLRTMISPLPSPGDRFGASLGAGVIGIGGGNILVGATHEDTGADNAGSAYLFDGTTGDLLRTFRNPTPAADDLFGSDVVASDLGVMVAARLDDTAANNAGAVYLFNMDSGNLSHTFFSPAPRVDDQFGSALALQGSDLLIGVPLDDTAALDGGAVYRFDAEESGLLKTYTSAAPGVGNQFGVAIAPWGDDVLVGAWHATVGTERTGTAQLLDGRTGTLLRRFESPSDPPNTPDSGDQFGYSLAVVGDSVAIGAFGQDATTADVGAVHLFDVAIRSAATDETGYYSIAAMAPGTHRLRQKPAPGYRQTIPLESETYTIALDPDGRVTDLDFGNQFAVENSSPVVADDQFEVNEDSTLQVTTGGVLENDTDEDGDHLSARLISDPAYGVLTFFVDGTFSYSPGGDFHGSDYFSYVAFDDWAESDPATVEITVQPVNDAPIAAQDTYQLGGLDTSLAIAALGIPPGILANDVDADDDPLDIVITTGVSHGNLNVELDGSFRYVPDPSFQGQDSFTYRVSDGTTLSAPAQVTIDVAPHSIRGKIFLDRNESATADVGEPGVAGWTVELARAATPGTPLETTQTDPYGRYGFAEVEPGSYLVHITRPLHFFTTLPHDGPDYRIDLDAGTIANHVDFGTVLSRPPFAWDDFYGIDQDTSLSVFTQTGVLVNDHDADRDPLVAELLDDVNSGTLVFRSDGSFVYTPHADFHGVDSFSYRVFDGWQFSSPATATLVVRSTDDTYEPNDVPTAAFDLGDHRSGRLGEIDGEALLGDDDWYMMDVAEADRHFQVELAFTHAQGNIDLAIYDAENRLFATAETSTDDERLEVVLPSGGKWYLKVFGANTQSAYDLVWSGSSLHPGDASLDGTTDVRDFMIWNIHKFTSGTDWTTGDFNGDEVTDVRDFMIWNAHKFTSAPAPVPRALVADLASEAKSAALEAAIGEIAWLHHIRRDRTDLRSPGNNGSVQNVVDRLLASHWL